MNSDILGAETKLHFFNDLQLKNISRVLNYVVIIERTEEGILCRENKQKKGLMGIIGMSNIIKNDKIIAWIKIVIGISMPIAVLIGYLPIPEYLVEFTCISNVLGGLLLVADGILNLRGKSVPGVFYRNISVGIFFVFAICMGSLSGAYHMNFEGAFFYLHAMSPVLFILCYILFFNDREGNAVKKLLVTPVLMLLYLLFDFVLGKFRGSFVYGFFKPDEVSITDALIIGVVFYLMMFAVGGLFLFLNKLAHKKKTKTY